MGFPQRSPHRFQDTTRGTSAFLSMGLGREGKRSYVVMRLLPVAGVGMSQRWELPPGGLTAGMLNEIGATADEWAVLGLLRALGLQTEAWVDLVDECGALRANE